MSWGDAVRMEALSEMPASEQHAVAPVSCAGDRWSAAEAEYAALVARHEIRTCRDTESIELSNKRVSGFPYRVCSLVNG